MAPRKRSRFGARKDKNQSSILQMVGFQREVEASENEFIDVESTIADEVNAHSAELNAEHDRILLARKTWRDSWLDDHDWLSFDHDKGKVFCLYCKEDKQCRSAYGKGGSTNLRTSAFKEHAESDQHRHSAWLVTKGKNSLLKVEKKRVESADKELLSLFRAAYLIRKEDLSYRSFVPLAHLLKVCKVDVPHLYNNDKACSDFVKCISKSLEQKVFEKVRSSPWFGIMADEATDMSVMQQLILYVSYLEDFQPKKSFLGILRLKEADAKTITSAIIDRLKEDGKLDMHKMIGFGSDGAAVMLGCRTGVSTRLKEQQPFMTSIHCVAHRTNLCVSSISKHESCKTICQKIDKLVNRAASYFTSSSQRGDLLAEIEEDLAYSRLRLEGICDTRWLSRHRAVQKLCEVLEPVMEVFRQNSASIFNELREFQVVYILHFFADILKCLTDLSLDFQRDWVDVTSVSSLVSQTKHQIKFYFLNEASALDLNGFPTDSKGYPIIPEFGSPDGYLAALRGAVKGDMFRSIEMTRNVDGSDLVEAIDFQLEFSRRVLESLDQRFEEHEILSCFKILSPAHMPRSAKELKDFGQQDVNKLMKFYGEPRHVGGVKFDRIISQDKFKFEFRKFKIQACTEWKSKNFLDTWTIILSEKMLREDKYVELTKLATIAMVHCASTAICERGFSQMNHIKDKYRNKLKTGSTDALMRISIEGPRVEALEAFDFADAIQIWKSSKNFRHIFSAANIVRRRENENNLAEVEDELDQDV